MLEIPTHEGDFLSGEQHDKQRSTHLPLFKRVVARRAVYHTLNVITISLYVRPSVCVKWVLGGGLDPFLKKMVSEHH